MDVPYLLPSSQLLDVQFTSESLARTLGINQSKALLWRHLSRKFTEATGPVAAQKKLDAMQVKTFQALDPTEKPKIRSRSRSTGRGSRRGKHHHTEEEPICPLGEYPANGKCMHVIIGHHEVKGQYTSVNCSKSPYCIYKIM